MPCLFGEKRPWSKERKPINTQELQNTIASFSEAAENFETWQGLLYTKPSATPRTSPSSVFGRGVESPTLYYLVKHDPDEMICVKITRLIILINQFHVALMILSGAELLKIFV